MVKPSLEKQPEQLSGEPTGTRERVGKVLGQPEANKIPENRPQRIYVACLAAYNNGILHGRWIDCNQDVEDIRAEIDQMLAESPEPGAEEFAIHDTDNLGGLHVDEFEDIEKLAELSMLIEEQGDIAAQVVSYCGGLDYLSEARRKLEENYQGVWDSMGDWAENYLESSGWLEKIPQELRFYFDFEKYALNFRYAGDIFVIEAGGEVHVFWNR